MWSVLLLLELQHSTMVPPMEWAQEVKKHSWEFRCFSFPWELVELKPMYSPLGADQIENEGPIIVQRFFDWFYWFIQLGSFLAYTAVVTVQQEVSFFYGYVITALSMFLAIMLFISGRKYYIIQPHKGSYLTDTLKMIWEGLKKIRCRRGGFHWLDRAKQSLGGTYKDQRVEDVKSVMRIVPIFLTFILYWTIYGQVSNNKHHS